jgi:UTP-glucose-1-phosphate uridylyltransferase
MAMEDHHDDTFELVTNLDRAAIESRLEEVRQAAESMLLAELAQQLTGVAGKSREELGARVGAAMACARDAGQKQLLAQLEMVELNLPNL